MLWQALLGVSVIVTAIVALNMAFGVAGKAWAVVSKTMPEARSQSLWLWKERALKTVVIALLTVACWWICYEIGGVVIRFVRGG